LDFVDEIKRIDLTDYVLTHYGIAVNSSGKASCPFHPPDTHPSLQFWIGDDGIHRFTDHHNDEIGTIIDFVMKKEGCSIREAIQKIKENGGVEVETGVQRMEIKYNYRNIKDELVFRKIKRVDNRGNKAYWFEHKQNGNWIRGKGDHELIPYNLSGSIGRNKAIICEGEKDAETVKSVAQDLELDYWITSAPNGKGAWPESITPYFKGMEEVIFLYDVGAEEDARSHASKLLSAFPYIHVFIAKVPLHDEGADITDYLNISVDAHMALLDIQTRAERFSLSSDTDVLLVETSEQLLQKSIPKIERLIDPFLERNGLTLIGGTKGVGKSLFVTQMALHGASGKSGFLSSIVEEPFRVLLIQQEVAESGMQDRLRKMYSSGDFDTQGRFFTKTTTGNQWSLTENKDKQNIITLVEKTEVDALILDPLYTFFPGELNQAKDMSRILASLMELKTNFNLSLVIVHHFSNKSSPDDPRSTAGKFLGHSNLANAADVVVGIDFLHPIYKDRPLPLPYNHYAVVETTTRHSDWPAKLFIERKEKQLLFQESSVMDELGKKIPPNEIIAFVAACGGEKLLADVISYFKDTNEAHENTIRKSIEEAIQMGKLEKSTVPGLYGRKILRITGPKH